MKVHIFEGTQEKENHIDLHVSEENTETEMARKFLDTFQISILGRQPEAERERFILPSEILYLEIVERRSFLYLRDSVWKTDITLQKFLELYSSQGFVRVSKSMAVNIYYIKELQAEINMRVNILLDNDEKVILNRNYRRDFYDFIRKIRMEAEG